MIDIVPSIAILDKKCVRLQNGDLNKPIFYPESPLQMARKFEESGIRKVHVIDLNGAREGSVVNYEPLEMIARHTQLEILFGGGVSDYGSLDRALENGAKMVVVGSMAAQDRELFTSWMFTYGRQVLMLSADVGHGKIRVKGWARQTEIDLMEHVQYFYERGILYMKCADVLRDGSMEGPNLELYQTLLEKFPGIRIYASGGIGNVEHISKLQDAGITGVIFGKAIYEGKLSLKELEKFIINS
jgi:phosphoribosylformimino-5-aminoimidazole carboxamide ribotide isomerase